MDAGQVTGPFTAEEAESHLPSAKEPFLWGRGLAEWLTPSEWKVALRTKGAVVTELTPREQPHWRFRVGGREQGPFFYNDLISALKRLPDYQYVEIHGEGFNDWVDIYGVQKIVDELGITRRAHQRVPIMGSLRIETAKGLVEAKVTSISEGGLGVNDAPTFPLGEKLRGILSSPNLFSDIHCTCEVVYVGQDGSLGLRFAHLPMEASAAVIEYVRKFQNMGER